MSDTPKLRLNVPLTVGGSRLPHFGEGVPFEQLLASKVDVCVRTSEPFFDLTMEEYNALKNNIFLRLGNSGHLEDPQGIPVPQDLLDALFNQTLTDLITKWCQGKWPSGPYSPLMHDLYSYMAQRIKTIRADAYESLAPDIYEPEMIKKLYYERPPVFDELEPMDLQRLLEELPPRSRQVLELRFGLDGGPALSLSRVGAELGVSKQRAEQLVDKALRRLHRLLDEWVY